MANENDDYHRNQELLNIYIVIENLRSKLAQYHDRSRAKHHKVVKSIVERRVYLLGTMGDHHEASQMLHKEVLENDQYEKAA